MKVPTLAASLSGLLATAAPALAALPPIAVKGANFVDTATNKRFVVVGVDYQPGGQAGFGNPGAGDPLSNSTACLRDAVLMQQLGVNTIRCYNVDNALNHDECMSIFDQAGIYAIIDVNTPMPGQSLNRDDPASTYNTDYLTHVFTTIDAFKGYPNVLAFTSANEIINTPESAMLNPPFMRALTRDMNNYIAKQAKRAIPVGYAAADVASTIVDQLNYLQCDNNGDNSRSTWFGLNDYEWCGAATFDSSGYNVLVQMFGGTSLPFVLSEYGCNNVLPRVFDEVTAIYGTNMTSFSGGLAYEFNQEANNFGLVMVNSNGSANLLGDYYNFQQKLSQVDASVLTARNASAEAVTPPKCSPGLITGSGFNNSFDLPPAPSGVQNMINNGVPNGPSGSIIKVTTTTVSLPVYGSDGAALKNLVLKDESDGNTPGAAPASGSGGSSGSSGSSGSGSKSAASLTSPATLGAMLLAAVTGLLVAAL